VEPILLPSPILFYVQPVAIPELKPLLENLKYAYLEDDEKVSVIISTSLEVVQEEKLLQVLRKHKRPLARSWQTFLISVYPSVYTEYYLRMELNQ